MLWLKIKILRDIKNFKNKVALNNYDKLLNLINNMNNNEKLTFSKLNKFDLKSLQKICNYNNVEIVSLPRFLTYEIIQHKLELRTFSVSDYYTQNILEFFELYDNYKIYLFKIENNIIRSHININDKERIRLVRNKKIQKINNI